MSFDKRFRYGVRAGTLLLCSSLFLSACSDSSVEVSESPLNDPASGDQVSDGESDNDSEEGVGSGSTDPSGDNSSDDDSPSDSSGDDSSSGDDGQSDSSGDDPSSGDDGQSDSSGDDPSSGDDGQSDSSGGDSSSGDDGQSDSSGGDSSSGDDGQSDDSSDDQTSDDQSGSAEQGNGSESLATLGLPAVSATGADTSDGPLDDSPTRAESLSINGAFIKDPNRSAGPPSIPTDLTLLLAAENWIQMSWAPSTDDQSVEAYRIYRDGQLIETVRYDDSYTFAYRNWVNTMYLDCNYTRFAACQSQPARQPLTGTTYGYSVAAVDNQGMVSPRSEEVFFSTLTPGSGAPDLSAYQMVFNEEFNGSSLDRFTWKTVLPWGENDIINRERQYFVNLFGNNNNVSHNPFVFTGDTLQITGIKTPPSELSAANQQPYLSGVITTADYFEMTYGYVEMRAKMAPGQGLLSTFYLFNQNYYKNKPEIDIVEYLGERPDKAYQTYHYYSSTTNTLHNKHSSPTMESQLNQNLSDNFHTYSVLWEPELIIWYIDGQEVRRLEGPRVSDEPMNIVAQLVIGSEWIGDPEDSSIPAVYEIDYIKAWQKP